MFVSNANLFDTALNLFNSVYSGHTPKYWGQEKRARSEYPLVNWAQVNEEEQLLTAALPGFSKGDVKVEIKGNLIRIQGKKTRGYAENHRLLHSERADIEFDRTFRLPYRINEEQVNAQLSNGLLTIHLKRADADKPKEITIQ